MSIKKISYVILCLTLVLGSCTSEKAEPDTAEAGKMASERTESVETHLGGCILLAPLTYGPLIEIVYMGVAAGWRRRGVGKLLLRRALQHCRAVGASELTAVVDRRNTPARQLYARFGFKPTVKREAYIYLCEAGRRCRKEHQNALLS